MVYSTDRSKAVVQVLIWIFVALWFILRGDLFYVLPCVILFLCFPVLLALRSPRLGKRELILVLFVRLFDLCLLRFVDFLFLLVSGKGCGLWLWHSLDFSLTFFFKTSFIRTKFTLNPDATSYKHMLDPHMGHLPHQWTIRVLTNKYKQSKGLNGGLRAEQKRMTNTTTMRPATALIVMRHISRADWEGSRHLRTDLTSCKPRDAKLSTINWLTTMFAVCRRTSLF